MGNDALQQNPTIDVAQHITVRGSDWLWAVFCIMAFSDLVVFIWMTRIPRGQRVFHQLAIMILSTASIAYFSMASNLGYTGVATEFGHMGFEAGTLRQLWYVRYIDWFVTTPALLLTLVLASGLPLSDIVTLVFFDIVMIVTGLVGGLVESQYKWGFFVFGCVALFYIWWVLAGPARSSAGVLGAGYKSAFTLSAAILSFLWLLYPIAWGLADGGNVISPDSEMIFYGILDVLAKPVFTMVHLWQLSRLDLTALQLSSGKFTSTAVHGDVEKHGRENFASGNVPSNGKKNFFARRGQYDANTNTNTNTNNTNNAVMPPVNGEPAGVDNDVALGRPSEATVVTR